MRQLTPLLTDAVAQHTSTLQIQMDERASKMQSQYEEQSTRMQRQLDEQAAKMAAQQNQLQEVLHQNHRFQETLQQRDSMFVSSMLRGQANEIRSRIRGYKDKQVQTARVQARLTASNGSMTSTDGILLTDLKAWLGNELPDIARLTSELQEEARQHGMPLAIADIQDFLNRPA